MPRSNRIRAQRRRSLIAGAVVVTSAFALAGLAGTAGQGRAVAAGQVRQSAPPLYLGSASYSHLDDLSFLEIGDRVESESAAEPDGSDHVVHERVLFHQTGPGILVSQRIQQGLGSPWTLNDDGNSTTITPADLGADGAFAPFPLSLNTGQAEGSSIIYQPLPYRTSIELQATGRNSNFDGIYRELPYGYPLPAGNALDASSAADQAAVSVLNSAGSDIAPPGIQLATDMATLGAAGAPTPLTTIDGADQIRSLTIQVPFADSVQLGNSTLQIYWDGQSTPAVNTPLKYLAGDGAGVYSPTGRQLVQGLLAGITSDGTTYTSYNLYYPMPFGSSARIVIVPDSTAASLGPIKWSVQYEPFTAPANWWGYFHANYTNIQTPPPGQDMTFLNYRGSGKLIGTVLNFGAIGPVLEGDPEIFLDGSKTPQIVYTGTEEWGLGGNYWNDGTQTSLALGGMPSATNNPPGADVEGAALYRFLVADSIPFNNQIVVHWQHGGGDNALGAESAAMMWYGTPLKTAIQTDAVSTGKPASRLAHGYSAPGQTLFDLSSGYEYIPNAPQVSGTVARLKTTATFTMKLASSNAGAFLRRTYDSCVAGQSARVYVAGKYAGTWFDQGVSGADFNGTPRCWRDEDFPLPAADTAGRTSVTITIRRSGPAWTASAYQLFSFVM